MEFICNDLKFKNKQTETQYVLLNSRLKAKKKKDKKERKANGENVTVKKVANKFKSKGKRARRSSKFQNKYQERINSIRHTEENIIRNREKYENSEKNN